MANRKLLLKIPRWTRSFSVRYSGWLGQDISENPFLDRQKLSVDVSCLFTLF